MRGDNPALWAWACLLQESIPQLRTSLRGYFACNGFLVVGLLSGGNLSRVSSRWVTPDFEVAIRHACRQAVISLFYLLLLVFAFGQDVFPLPFLISFGSGALALLFLTNRFLPACFARFNFKGVRREQILLIGSAPHANLLGGWLASKRLLGFDFVGLLTDDPAAESPNNLNVLGGLKDLDQAVDKYKVSKVILVEFPSEDQVLQHIVNLCEYKGLRMMVVSDLHHKFGWPVTIYPDDDFFFLGLREEPLENPFNRMLKRTLDIAVSLPVVLFLLPALMGSGVDCATISIARAFVIPPIARRRAQPPVSNPQAPHHACQ